MILHGVDMAILKRHLLLSFLWTLISTPQDSEPKNSQHKPKLRILPGRLVTRFDFYENCKNISSLAIVVTNSSMKTLPSNLVVVEADFLITRVIQPLTQVIMKIHNCEDRTSGSCQLFQTWRFGKESCSMMEMKNQLWSPVFESIHPPLKCPQQPGKYELRNGNIDLRLIHTLPFPLERYYWRIQGEAYDPDFYHCSIVGAKILRSFTS